MGATARQPSSRRFSLAHLVLLIPWVALVIDAWAPIRDNSFLWHIRAGSLQASAGRVLTQDPFSFTMFGEPWLTQSWLAELLYAWGERVAELGFVPPMMLTLNAITIIGIALVAFRLSKSVAATALVSLLSVTLLISFLVPRPVIFSYALFVLVVLAWQRTGTRWSLPFLFWIWASVHGSFVIGLAYLGLSWLVRREWRSWPTLLASGLVTLATAHGLGVLVMLQDFAESRETLLLLTEWRKPELISFIFLPFAVGVGIIVLGAFRGLITPRHLWLIVPFLLLGLSSTRAVPPAWLGLVPLVALSMSGLSVGEARRFSTPAAAVFVIVVGVLPFLVKSDASLDEDRFPIQAISAMDDSNTFHDDRAGGYLIWAQGPERLVFMDDRAELYGDRMAEFVAVRAGQRDWRPVFDRDGIEQALLRADQKLIETLMDSGWFVVYDDDSYVVLRP